MTDRAVPRWSGLGCTTAVDVTGNATCAFSVMLALTEFVLFYLLFSWRSSFGYQFGGEPSFVGEVDINPRHKSAGRPASFVPTDSIDVRTDPIVGPAHCR